METERDPRLITLLRRVSKKARPTPITPLTKKVEHQMNPRARRKSESQAVELNGEEAVGAGITERREISLLPT